MPDLIQDSATRPPARPPHARRPIPRQETGERHLLGLIRRHRALDERIDRQARSGLTASPGLAALKRLRLALKDRITTLLRRGSRSPAQVT